MLKEHCTKNGEVNESRLALLKRLLFMAGCTADAITHELCLDFKVFGGPDCAGALDCKRSIEEIRATYHLRFIDGAGHLRAKQHRDD